MKHDTESKAKFRRLVRRLRPLFSDVLVDVETIAVGILERLWNATTRDAPQGDIGRLDDDMIAESVGWHGSPDDLIEILVESKWLDRCEVHRLVIHDWPDHAPDFIRGNLKRWNRQFAIATCSKKAAIAPCPSTIPRASTIPNLTKPNLTNSDASASVSADADAPGQIGREADFISRWNRTAGVVAIRGDRLSDKRRVAFRNRLAAKNWWTDFLACMDHFPLPFVTSGRSGTWRPDADWILRPDTVNNILEGKYDGVQHATAAEILGMEGLQ